MGDYLNEQNINIGNIDSSYDSFSDSLSDNEIDRATFENESGQSGSTRTDGSETSEGIILQSFEDYQTETIDYTSYLNTINENICVLNDNFSIAIGLLFAIISVLLISGIAKLFKGIGL